MARRLNVSRIRKDIHITIDVLLMYTLTLTAAVTPGHWAATHANELYLSMHL
jgi:hypothetical protein